jgi:Type I restriction modification DNA specificity domain
MHELPDGWEYRRVDQVGDVQLGRQRSPAMMTGPYMRPYLRVANVLDGYIDYSDVLEMNFAPHEAQTFNLQPGDVLLNEGQAIDLVGRCAIFDGPTGMCFQNTLLRFRPRTVLPKFAAAVFKHWLDHGEFRKITRQTTSIAHLGSTQFSAMRFPYAPLQEQQRITEILGSTDEQIKLSLRLLAKQEATLKSLEFAAIRDSISSSPMTIGEIIQNAPGGLIQTGPFGSQLHAYEYTESGVPVVMPQDMIGQLIAEEKIVRIRESKAQALSRHRMIPGDVVFGRRGDLSRCAVVAPEQEGWLCGTGCLLARLPSGPVRPEWLTLTYRNDVGQRQVLARAVGSTMVNLNTKIISDITIPVPDVEVQERTISALAIQRRVINQLSLEVDKLNIIKQGLMNDLLAGRVRVAALYLRVEFSWGSESLTAVARPFRFIVPSLLDGSAASAVRTTPSWRADSVGERPKVASPH